jgi:chromosome segregation ATPase
LATLDAGGSIDFSRIDQERINDLEEQLVHVSQQYEQQRQTISQLESSLQSEKAMRADAEEREADLAKRAAEAATSLERSRSELEQLRTDHARRDADLREHSERLIAMSSSTQQQGAEILHLRSQLDEATAGRDDHLRLLEEVQQAVAAAGDRADHLHDQHERAVAKHRDLEAEIVDLRTELDAKTREAEEAVQRKLTIEDSWTKSREEADTLRKVTTSRIGELLDSHKALRADDNRASRVHQEKAQALELETTSLRKLLNEAGSRVDVAQAGVSQYRQRAHDLEHQQQALHSELRSVKAKLASTRGEIALLREEANAKAIDIRARDAQLSESQTRCAMLRNILADSGVAVSDDDIKADSDSYMTRRLEEQLTQQSEAADKARGEAAALTRQLDDAQAREQDHLQRIERLQQDRSSSPSMRSLSPESSNIRVADVEKKLAETEAAHKKKVHQLESDYQTAVQYVK